MTAPLSTGSKVVAGAFVASGIVHLVKPEVFLPLMPSWVPAHREVIVGSGYAELACAAGMLFPPTRKVSALASTAVLLGVFPGNLKMAADAQRSKNPVIRFGTLGRLPLQLPMIRATWKQAHAS
jgi:uncharacterized membrane protein